VLGAAGAAQAQCRTHPFEGQDFTVCEAHLGEDLRLFLNDAEGQVYGSFARIDAALGAEGQHLAFAMNAGMFHPDRRPVGLYVEEGEQAARIVLREGPGNFGMLPNGVFCIADDRFAIYESRAYEDTQPDCRFATQSGPLLVIEGALHPRFLPDSTSQYIRNGVGVSDDGTRAVFVISDQPVTFHRFARFYRDALGLNQALYFDGSVSRLYAPELQRSDWGLPMGPVVGLVAPLG
jgi:uncharacterized protein YigE (DUF2233 family)